MALYDSGCIHIVIDRDVALDLLIPTGRTTDTSLKDGKTNVSTEITIGRVTSERNDRKVNWQMYVTPLDTYAVYLGAVVAHSIGIYISGVKNTLRPTKHKLKCYHGMYIETFTKPLSFLQRNLTKKPQHLSK